MTSFQLAYYSKIPKISPGAYIFQRPFLRGLFLEGPIFGGAYVRREICVSNSIGLACSGKEIYHFCFVLLCIRGQIPSTSPPGGLYLEGQFNGGFFALRVWGLIHGGAYFRNLTVAQLVRTLHRYRKGQGSNPSKPFRLSFGNCISCVFIWDAAAVFAFIFTLRFATIYQIYEFMYSLFQNKHNYVSFLL